MASSRVHGTLRIGSRGSALSLWQARWVAARISDQPDSPVVEIVVIETRGDRLADVPLSTVDGRGFFTSEIERALAERKIDLAVHSLKDLATEDPAGLLIAAVTEREDPRDVLVGAAGAAGATIDALAPGARVGTSSLRRQAFLRQWRSDLEPCDLRGNVPTRLAKLDAGDYDAIILAAAGLRRLGLAARITEVLDPERFPPAPGQGALALQTRGDDQATRALVRALEHPATRCEITAERELLAAVAGGCLAPVGALARIDGQRLRLSAKVASPDGREQVSGEVAVEVAGDLANAIADCRAAGRRLAAILLERGAGEILERARSGR